MEEFEKKRTISRLESKYVPKTEEEGLIVEKKDENLKIEPIAKEERVPSYFVGKKEVPVMQDTMPKHEPPIKEAAPEPESVFSADHDAEENKDNPAITGKSANLFDPKKKKKITLIIVVAALALILMWLLIYMGKEGSVIKKKSVYLNAVVEISNSSVRIENSDEYDWDVCRINLISLKEEYSFNISPIRAQSSQNFDYGSFRNLKGDKFNSAEDKAYGIEIFCDNEDSRGYWPQGAESKLK